MGHPILHPGVFRRQGKADGVGEGHPLFTQPAGCVICEIGHLVLGQLVQFHLGQKIGSDEELTKEFADDNGGLDEADNKQPL